MPILAASWGEGTPTQSRDSLSGITTCGGAFGACGLRGLRPPLAVWLGEGVLGAFGLPLLGFHIFAPVLHEGFVTPHIFQQYHSVSGCSAAVICRHAESSSVLYKTAGIVLSEIQ